MTVAKDVIECAVRRALRTGLSHYVWKNAEGQFTTTTAEPPSGTDFWKVRPCRCGEIHYEVHTWNPERVTWEVLP